MDLRFAILYVAGSMLLVIYAIQIRDLVFVVLNGRAAVLSGTSLNPRVSF